MVISGGVDDKSLGDINKSGGSYLEFEQVAVVDAAKPALEEE